MRAKPKPWICISPSTGAMLAQHLVKASDALRVGPLGRLFRSTPEITERALQAASIHNRAVALANSLSGTPYGEAGWAAAKRVGETMLSLHRLSMLRRRTHR